MGLSGKGHTVAKWAYLGNLSHFPWREVGWLGREGRSWPLPQPLPTLTLSKTKKESLGQLERMERFPGALGSDVRVGKAGHSQWKALIMAAFGLQPFINTFFSKI